MLRFFKTKNNDTDVVTNHDILFNDGVSTEEIKVQGLKLGDKAALIDLDHVSATTFEKPPAGILPSPNGRIQQTWKNNKVFYESPDGQKEYLLSDRINSVLTFGGILHMRSGAKYVIRDSKIIGIGIHGDIVKPYQKISKANIEKKFGKASHVKEYHEKTDGGLWNTQYIYKNRSMVVNFYDPDDQIDFINIGSFPYSRR